MTHLQIDHLASQYLQIGETDSANVHVITCTSLIEMPREIGRAFKHPMLYDPSVQNLPVQRHTAAIICAVASPPISWNRPVLLLLLLLLRPSIFSQSDTVPVRQAAAISCPSRLNPSSSRSPVSVLLVIR